MPEAGLPSDAEILVAAEAAYTGEPELEVVVCGRRSLVAARRVNAPALEAMKEADKS
jgi:hypothetical protein